MKELISQEQQSSDQTAIEDRASDWIERRDREDWGAGDQAQLDSWLAESMAHRIAYWRLEAAWDRTERLAALRPPDSKQTLLSQNSRLLPTLLKAAVVFAVLATVGVLARFYVLMPRYQTYATTVGGHETLTLNDGSLIELSTNTVVEVFDGSRQRAVKLEKGEAYFEINHDAVRPFVVTAGNHRVTDLGTKFLVRNDADRVQVALLEGRARLDSVGAWNNKHSALLTPGEVAVATGDSISTTQPSRRNLSDALGWRRGLLIFYHTSLDEAAAEFNRYNREKLVVGDARIGRFVVNGAFPTNGVAVFTQAAREVFGVRIEHRGSVIVISR